MSTYIPRPESMDRYDDGVAIDYASMIRMWSAFDRSLNAFKRRCGVIVSRPASKQASAEDLVKGRTK
jgi:hypothetical protein